MATFASLIELFPLKSRRLQAYTPRCDREQYAQGHKGLETPGFDKEELDHDATVVRDTLEPRAVKAYRIAWGGGGDRRF